MQDATAVYPLSLPSVRWSLKGWPRGKVCGGYETNNEEGTSSPFHGNDYSKEFLESGYLSDWSTDNRLSVSDSLFKQIHR